MKNKSSTPCSLCSYYIYDEDMDMYICDINLDEDEMIRFVESSARNCPYFNLYDEYKTVRKQN